MRKKDIDNFIKIFKQYPSDFFKILSIKSVSLKNRKTPS